MRSVVLLVLVVSTSPFHDATAESSDQPFISNFPSFPNKDSIKTVPDVNAEQVPVESSKEADSGVVPPQEETEIQTSNPIGVPVSEKLVDPIPALEDDPIKQVGLPGKASTRPIGIPAQEVHPIPAPEDDKIKQVELPGKASTRPIGIPVQEINPIPPSDIIPEQVPVESSKEADPGVVPPQEETEIQTSTPIGVPVSEKLVDPIPAEEDDPIKQVELPEEASTRPIGIPVQEVQPITAPEDDPIKQVGLPEEASARPIDIPVQEINPIPAPDIIPEQVSVESSKEADSGVVPPQEETEVQTSNPIGVPVSERLVDPIPAQEGDSIKQVELPEEASTRPIGIPAQEVQPISAPEDDPIKQVELPEEDSTRPIGIPVQEINPILAPDIIPEQVSVESSKEADSGVVPPQEETEIQTPNPISVPVSERLVDPIPAQEDDPIRQVGLPEKAITRPIGIPAQEVHPIPVQEKIPKGDPIKQVVLPEKPSTRPIGIPVQEVNPIPALKGDPIRQEGLPQKPSTRPIGIPVKELKIPKGGKIDPIRHPAQDKIVPVKPETLPLYPTSTIPETRPIGIPSPEEGGIFDAEKIRPFEPICILPQVDPIGEVNNLKKKTIRIRQQDLIPGGVQFDQVAPIPIHEYIGISSPEIEPVICILPFDEENPFPVGVPPMQIQPIKKLLDVKDIPSIGNEIESILRILPFDEENPLLPEQRKPIGVKEISSLANEFESMLQILPFDGENPFLPKQRKPSGVKEISSLANEIESILQILPFDGENPFPPKQRKPIGVKEISSLANEIESILQIFPFDEENPFLPKERKPIGVKEISSLANEIESILQILPIDEKNPFLPKQEKPIGVKETPSSENEIDANVQTLPFPKENPGIPSIQQERISPLISRIGIPAIFQIFPIDDEGEKFPIRIPPKDLQPADQKELEILPIEREDQPINNPADAEVGDVHPVIEEQ